MDTSKEYIEMCKETTEIQELWIPQEGDFIFNSSANNGKGHLFVNYQYQPYDNRSDWVLLHTSEHKERYNFDIWLPGQDQLQSIILGDRKGSITEPCTPFGLIGDFYMWLDRNLYLWKPNWSMEQLWLAFVMHMKYNKVWKDNEWIEP